jgi:hypothetical protein
VNKNRRRLLVWIVLMGVIAGVGCCAFSQSEATEIESNDSMKRILANLLVGVSDANFSLRPDTAGGPYARFFGTSLSPNWLTIADVAIAGFAHLQSTEEASLVALLDNLEATLPRIGDLAADILGSLPLIIEIQAEDPFLVPVHTIGWIAFDAVALRTAQAPVFIEADYPMKRLGFYADDLAGKIGIALGADKLNSEDWRRGYFPGVGIYVEVEEDMYTGLLPHNLNTTAEWEDTLALILGGLGVEALSAMAEDERVIIGVDNLIGWGMTFLIIGRDDLLGSSSWEIRYWDW